MTATTTTTANKNDPAVAHHDQHQHRQIWNALVAVFRMPETAAAAATTQQEQICRLQSILHDANLTSVRQVVPPPRDNGAWNLLCLALLQSLRRRQDDSSSSDDALVRWMLEQQQADPWCTSGYLKFSAWELVVWHNHVPALRLLWHTKPKGTTAAQSAVLAKSLRMALEMGYWEAAKLLLPADTCLPETGNILHWTLSEANRYFRIETRSTAGSHHHHHNSNDDDADQRLPTTDLEGTRDYHHFTTEVLPFLLKHVADPAKLCRQARADGTTPLHVVGPFVAAAQQILLQRMDDGDTTQLWQAVGPQGTVLHTAVRFPEVLKLLLTHAPGELLSLVHHNREQQQQQTPLAAACRLGALASVQVFLQHGTQNVFEEDLTEHSVLCVAANGPSLDILFLLLQHAAGQGRLSPQR